LVDTLSGRKFVGRPRFLTLPDVGSEIASRKLLLWNFFPFFRGGTGATGNAGLPNSGTWRQDCWDLLEEFLAAVDAETVILACNDNMIPLLKNHTPVPELISSKDWSWETGAYAPSPQAFKDHNTFRHMRWYRVVHPYAWISKHFKAHVDFMKGFRA
jgi:hypothetical protein